MGSVPFICSALSVGVLLSQCGRQVISTSAEIAAAGPPQRLVLALVDASCNLEMLCILDLAAQKKGSRGSTGKP